MRNRAHAEALLIFLLGEEMEGDPSGREEVEAAAIKTASHSPQHH
jgi:hypothetical protein